MEGSYKDDFKNVLQFNLVPKVEPSDEEFVLCGEFVDTVPPVSTPLLRTEENKDPLSGGITGANPFGLKELKIIAKDCLKELATIKADIKDEPEEDIYDDSLASHEVDEPSTDEQITEQQTEAETKISWIYTLKKTQLKEELQKFGLPTKGNAYEQCRLLSHFIRTGYRPSESKTTDPGASASSAATLEDPKSPINVSSLPETTLSPEKKRKYPSYETKAVTETGWIYTLRRYQLKEELRKFGLPTEGNTYEQCRLLSNFITTGNYQPTENKTTDPGASASSAATLEAPKSPIDVSPNRRKIAQWLPQSNSASQPETPSSPTKKRKKRTYNYEDTSSSESDHDESYSPKRRFGISASKKKISTEKKGKSSKDKKTPVKVDSDNEKLTSDSSQRNENVLKTPQSDSLSLREEDLLPVKKEVSDNDKTKAEPRTNWIWSLTKARVTEELLRIGLPTQGSRDERRKCLSNFVKTGNYRPSESKTTDPGASASSAATTEDPKSNYQTKAEPRTNWIWSLTKARVTEELLRIGLPTQGSRDERRKRLSNFVKTGNYRPSESKTTDPGASASSAATTEDPKSNYQTKAEPRTNWIWSLTKARVTEELLRIGLPTQGSRDERRKRLSNFVKTGNYRPSESKTTDPGASASSAATTEDPKSTKAEPRTNWIWSSTKARVTEELLRIGLPTQGSRDERRRRLSNFVKTGNYRPSESKTTDPGASASSAATTEDPKSAEVDGVLWSCCDMQFELFSAYNNHKAQVHLIEELKCSVCIDQSFSSIDEIEKHYLDVHTDSSWTSFHCLDCRLVFGIKSSFFDHKAKCSESQNVCSEILDSILDFAVTRKKPKKVKGTGNADFRLSCCENIIENFEDFFFHKFSDHNISLLTCGLCLCVKDTESQLRSHYRKFHFSKFWKRLELKKSGDNREDASSMVSSSTQNDDVSNEADDGSSDSDEVRAKPVQCSALQDGILCQCCDCTKLVEGTQSLDAIAIEDLNDLNKPFQCEPCNLRFRHKSRLDRHLRTHEGVKPFPCDVCGSAFTKRLSLKNHKLYKHSTNPFQQSCSICGKVLVSKSTLKKHIANVHMHANKNIQFKCEYCEKIYFNRNSYLKHIHSFHTKGKDFICDHCSKVFYDKRLLISHMQRMHLPNEKYECQKCDHTFKTKAYLHSHNMNVHSDKQLYCELCGKMFRTNERFKLHMAGHSDNKPFICQTCGKGFKRYCNLQQHQYTHSDSRPHVCNICGQTFRLRTHVKQHMAIHGIIRNHKCPICEKAFSRKSELKCHLPTHRM